MFAEINLLFVNNRPVVFYKPQVDWESQKDKVPLYAPIYIFSYLP